VSLKVHFLGSHLDFFPDNLGAVSDEHGERFHQDIYNMEKHCAWFWIVLTYICLALPQDSIFLIETYIVS
jgi:hypothetical protein